MRLALVTSDFPPATGGIETLFAALARELAAVDDVTVIAPAMRGSAEVDASRPYRVVRVPRPDGAFPATLAPVLAALAPLDATLHAQWPSLPAALALRRAGRIGRVVSYAHGRELLLRPFSSLPPVQRAYDAVRRTSLRSADHVIAVSRYTAALVSAVGVPPERIAFVPPGVELGATSPSSSATFRARTGLGARPLLVAVSRLVRRKGIDVVLRALPDVLRAVPDAMLAVVGDGPERHRLEALAASLGIVEHVRFAGRVDDETRAAWLASATVFVSPSRSEPPDVEGFGIAYLEAAAAGVPQVAARVGGVPDAVSEDVSGLLVPPDDAPAVAAAVVRLLVDGRLRARLGAGGRARAVAEHGWPAIAERVRGLLAEGL